MSTRRPIASSRSSALPTLVALLAAGVSVEGSSTDAHAQTPPRADAGVRPTPPPPRPPGGIGPVHPHPAPPTPPTPPRPEAPINVDGGIGKVSASKM